MFHSFIILFSSFSAVVHLKHLSVAVSLFESIKAFLSLLFGFGMCAVI